VFLVIAGPDSSGYRAAIQRIIKQEKVENHVVFTGMLEGSVNLSALAAADIFVLPSYSEGLPTAALEALASGCPVIVSPACNLPEVGEVGAGLVTGVSAEEVAGAIRTLLDDPALRRRMGRVGRGFAASRFGWRPIAEQMATIYEDVIQGGRVSRAWIVTQ
jgi:glycosyltransferase involved in cell wall biosynthesis